MKREVVEITGPGPVMIRTMFLTTVSGITFFCLTPLLDWGHLPIY